MEVGMQNRYIMTAFGKDRPGIVADVTQVLYENGCNLEDTTMSMLSDEFTINLLFSSNDENIEATLLEGCRSLEQQKKISAFIRPLQERRITNQVDFPTCTVHVEGMDQAGIVYKISQFLSVNGLNIIDLKSTVKVTPESGTALYLMDIHIQTPDSTSINAIEEGLNIVAEELNVEITVSC
jgi:glycine cleavage system transcriptional repressor